jgi:hypothetical protein
MFLNLFDAREAKKAARTLEKELAVRGLELAHGQALDVLAKLAGKHDWKQVAREREPAALDARLMPMEREHIRENADNDYGEEAALLVHNGFQLRYSAQSETPDYVRVCDPLGREIAYWVSDEWRDDPELVMGAILGALAQGEPMEPAKGGLRPAAKTSGEQPEESQREPRIQDVSFTDLTAVRINGDYWDVHFVEPDALAQLMDDTSAELPDDADKELLEESDPVVVWIFNDDEPPHVTEDMLRLRRLQQMRWDALSGCFVDEAGNVYDFIYAQRFADAWKQQA